MHETPVSRSEQLSTSQPVRGADRNRSLPEQSEQPNEEMLLPSLADGVTLLDIEGSRGVPVLHSVVLDHLLFQDGPAFWVDANGHATTASLARIAPSRRLLDRIQVARGFTAYQHYGALCDLPDAVDDVIRDSVDDPADHSAPWDLDRRHSSECTPSLIVLPAVDAQYRREDSLSDTDSRTLQARALARARTYAEGYDVPVLVTRTAADEFTEPVAAAADHHLECKQTRMGPRFVGEDFQTLVYPVEDGTYYQTTFAYWQQILDTRAAHAGVDTSSSGIDEADPSPTAGTAPTVDGTQTTPASNPLTDAWVASGPGGQ